MAAGGDAAVGLIPGLKTGKKLGKALDKAEDVADAAEDVSRASKGKTGSYIPARTLPTDGYGVPTPDAPYPHTQLGRSKPKYGSEPQAREWDYGSNGKLQPQRDIDFSDHGTPSVHTNPH